MTSPPSPPHITFRMRGSPSLLVKMPRMFTPQASVRSNGVALIIEDPMNSDVRNVELRSMRYILQYVSAFSSYTIFMRSGMR